MIERVDVAIPLGQRFHGHVVERSHFQQVANERKFAGSWGKVYGSRPEAKKIQQGTNGDHDNCFPKHGGSSDTLDAAKTDITDRLIGGSHSWWLHTSVEHLEQTFIVHVKEQN